MTTAIVEFPRKREFEHYRLGIWQELESYRYWMDGEPRTAEELGNAVRRLVNDCETAAAMETDDEERFKIAAVARLLQELGCRLGEQQAIS